MDETVTCELDDEEQVSKNAEDNYADYSSQINYWSPHSYPWSKKAIDLSIHSRSECQKTIFEDAEYFAQNYSYKLMPITFEVVNETIIHIEHNYCYPVPKADNENKDNRTTGNLLTEIGERNYKKRKSKVPPEENDFNSVSDSERLDKEKLILKDFVPSTEYEEFVPSGQVDEENFNSVQPLDLSLPFLQEQKSDNTLRESHGVGSKIKSEIRNSVDIQQLKINESNKENVKNNSREIEVTISRPGQKEYYQPCDIFLNDVARISQDLIKNDCYEIEIIDRTHSQDFRSAKSRTYYIVSQSTWRAFKNSTERIILTNDLNIGQPVQNNEKIAKPTYLIFDQNSLTESLARICEKKGGSFEYTCLEELKEPITKVQENRRELQGKDNDNASTRKVNSDSENCSAFDENRTCNNYTFEDRSEEKEKVVTDRETLKIANSIETSILQKLLLSEDKPQAKGMKKVNVNEIESHNLSDTGKSFAESVVRVGEKTELFEKVVGSGDANLKTLETEVKTCGGIPKAVSELRFSDEEKLFKPTTQNLETQNTQVEKEKLQISNTITLNIESTNTNIVEDTSNNDTCQITSSKRVNEIKSETENDLQEHEKFAGKTISSKGGEDLTAAVDNSFEKLPKVTSTPTSETKGKSKKKNKQDVISEYSLRKRKKSNQTEKHQAPKEMKRHAKQNQEQASDEVLEQNNLNKGNEGITETPPGRKTRSSSGSALLTEKVVNSFATKIDVGKPKNEEEHFESDDRRRIVKKRESKSAALIKICGSSKKFEGGESKTPRKRTLTGGDLEVRNFESGSGSCKKKKTPDNAILSAQIPNADTKLTPSSEMTFTGYELRSGNKNKSDFHSTKICQADTSNAVASKNSSVGRIELRSSGNDKIKKDPGRNLRSRHNDAKAANSKKINSTGNTAKNSNRKGKQKEILMLKKQKGKKR